MHPSNSDNEDEIYFSMIIDSHLATLNCTGLINRFRSTIHAVPGWWWERSENLDRKSCCPQLFHTRILFSDFCPSP